MVIALALVAAVGWGASDYFGGDSSRGVSPLVVVAVTELLGCALLVPVLLAAGAPFPAGGRLLLAVGAGVSTTVELGLIYRAISDGLAFITAPVGALGALGAVAVGLAGGESLSLLAGVGIACALTGGAVSAWVSPSDAGGRDGGSGGGRGGGSGGAHDAGSPAVRSPRHALLLCVGAAAALATTLILLHAAGRLNPVWVTAVQHASTAASAAIAVLVGPRGSRPALRWVPLPRGRGWKVLVGAVAGTSGDLAYVAASRHGALGIVSAISSLYPVATIALGATLLVARPSRRQAAGIVMALAGAVLLGTAA